MTKALSCQRCLFAQNFGRICSRWRNFREILDLAYVARLEWKGKMIVGINNGPEQAHLKAVLVDGLMVVRVA